MYFDTPFDHAWLEGDEQQLLERLLLWKVIQPSFGGKSEEWTLGGKTETWNIGHLLLALMGRLLYPVTCADNWRLTTWLWGESSATRGNRGAAGRA